MTPDIYAEWMRLTGHPVMRTASSYWHSQNIRVWQAFPYHWQISPSEDEIRDLMRKNRLIGVRYSLPAAASSGMASYHVAYTGGSYDLDQLSAWARKNVRRGMRECTVEPITFERYVREGWELRVDTLARQQRHIRETRQQWQRHYEAADGLPGFEVWAAQVGARLAATLVVFRMEDWFYMVYQQCHRDFLREHAPNALSFVVTQDLVQRPGVRGIFYGVQSLDAPASVDEFKFRMGYRAIPARQRICFHPAVTPLINRFTHGLLRTGCSYFPGQYTLAKAEGMFRLSLGERDARVRTLPDTDALPDTARPVCKAH